MKLFCFYTTCDVVWWEKASELTPEGGRSASRRSSNLWATLDCRGDQWRVNTWDFYLSSHKTVPAGATKGLEATNVCLHDCLSPGQRRWRGIKSLQLFRGQSAIGRRFRDKQIKWIWRNCWFRKPKEKNNNWLELKFEPDKLGCRQQNDLLMKHNTIRQEAQSQKYSETGCEGLMVIGETSMWPSYW